MKRRKKLRNTDLARASGSATPVGMPNPVAGMTEEEARKRAALLGDGKDMGSYRTMSGEEFMKWWESSNKSSEKNT